MRPVRPMVESMPAAMTDIFTFNYYKKKYPDVTSTYAEMVKREDTQGLIPSVG